MLTVTDLMKSYGSEHRRKKNNVESEGPPLAVDGVSFNVEPGELFTLLGPSGCGKTTTLRSIAGLEHPDSGRIEVADRVLFDGAAGARRAKIDLPANKRELGMVFQSYAIWPHMTVFDNVAFPLQVKPRSKRPSKAVIAERVERVLETMELRAFAGRQATQLSGGQQQRLALARALVIEPSLLLLDEPLSNLDAKLRESLRFELKRLQRELGITSIYVTHDQVEALALSSHIAVLNKGRIEQVGKPREIYTNPRTKFVAEFIGTSNFIRGTIRARSGDKYTVETGEGRLVLHSPADYPVGSESMVSVRPESVRLLTERPSNVQNAWSGTVTTRAFLGEAVDHVVAVGKHDLRVRCHPHISVSPGTEVYLDLDPESLTLVPLD